MADSVEYREDNSIVVGNINKEDVTIYAHPGNDIRLDFDISKLEKDIVNGDLIIKTYSGGKLTIANYALMMLDGNAPIIEDALGTKYNGDVISSSIFNTAFITDEKPSKFVVSRKVASPSTESSVGENLSSSPVVEVAESDKTYFVGTVETNQQSAVMSFTPLVQPFAILSLFYETEIRYDIDEIFSYTASTILNQDQPSTLPTPIRLINTLLVPLYGALEFINAVNVPEGRDTFLRIYNGGGILSIDEAADYMLFTQNLDHSRESGSIYHVADDTNEITRGFSVSFADSNVILREIKISGLPSGINMQSSDNYTVLPQGKGSFIVKPTTRGSNINIMFSYETGLPEGVSDIIMSIEGLNIKYNSLAISTKRVKFDFKEVRAIEDIGNYYGINIFTFSTLIDPLNVRLTDLNDYVIGGLGNHTYELNAGDDIFIAGRGNNKVDLGDGNDEFHVGVGNDIVVGGDGIDSIIFQQDKIDINAPSSSILLVNGQVIVTSINSVTRANNKTILSEMEILNLDERANLINIDSTSGFSNFEIKGSGLAGDTGAEQDTIQLNKSSIVYFNAGYITTDNGAGRVSFKSQSNRTITTVLGSNDDDIFYAADDFHITFDGKGGRNTAHYDDLAGRIEYDAIANKVTKVLGEDIVKNISTMYGTEFADTFYAKGTLSMNYYGERPNSSSVALDTVSYEKETVNGVTVDFTKIGFIEVTKAGGNKDNLYGIELVIASQADDTFIVGNNTNNSYDGKGHVNGDTIDYSRVSIGIEVIIQDSTIPNILGGGASGVINKDTYTDTFRDIEIFKGTSSNDTFTILNDAKDTSLSFHGGTSITDQDTVDYSALTDTALTFTYNVAGSSMRKGNSSTAQSDKITAIERIITSNKNDTFIFSNFIQLQSIDLLQAGDNDTFTFGDSNPGFQGDQLQFTESTALDLSQIFPKIANFESLRLNGINNEVSLSTGDLAFKHIFGNSSSSSNDKFINNTIASTTFTFEDSAKIHVESNIIDLYIFNFDEFVGTSSSDVFIINADDILTKSYKINARDGADELNYSATTNTYLTFNLDYRGDPTYTLSVQKGTNTGAKQDLFAGITDIKGGNAGNKFLINPNSTYNIIGGTGSDTISYENYARGLIALDTTQYNNIDNYILTNFIDTITFDPTHSYNGLVVDGGRGDDIVNISDGTDIQYIIGAGQGSSTNGIILSFASPSPNPTNPIYLSNFVKLNGSNQSSTFTVRTLDNSPIVTGKILYFLSSNNAGIVDYSTTGTAGTAGITFDIGVTDGFDASTRYIAITKLNGSRDYLLGIQTLNLSKGNDTINIDLSTLSEFAGLVVDAGDGTDTIDFSISTSSLTYDMVNNTINNVSLSIFNWEKLIGTAVSDTFIVANDTRNYIFDGGLDNDTLDYSNITNNLTINLITEKSIIGTTEKDTFSSIESFIGGSATNTFILVAGGNYALDAGSGTNSIVDYSQMPNFNQQRGFIFTIDSNGDGDVTKIFDSSIYYDSLKNIKNIIGTSADDIFNYTYNTGTSNILTIDGKDGKDRLELTITGTALGAGLTFDLVNEIIKNANNDTVLNIKNLEDFKGSDNYGDTFILTAGTFTNRGSINGGTISVNDPDDIIDLRQIRQTGSTTDQSFIIETDIGRVYFKGNNNTPITNTFVNFSNIQKIILGGGNDTLIIDNSLTSLKEIDGGGGINSVSFIKLFNPIDTNVTNINTGNNNIIITGFTSFILTNYADKIRFDDTQAILDNNYNIDGGADTDTADYSAYTATGVSITVDNTNVATVNRGLRTDTLTNFGIFHVGSSATENNNIFVGALDKSFSFFASQLAAGPGPGPVVNTLDYSNTTSNANNSLLVNFSDAAAYTLTIYKYTNNIFTGVDTSLYFNKFKGTSGADVYLLDGLKTQSIDMELDLSHNVQNSVIKTLDFKKYEKPFVYTEFAVPTTGLASAEANVDLSSGNRDLYTIRNDRSLVNTLHVLGNSRDNTFKPYFWGSFFDGKGGDNTLDYSNFQTTTGIDVNLTTGIVSQKAGGKSDTFANIRKVFGVTSAPNDFIGLRDDIGYNLTGGSAIDSVDYSGSNTSLTVNINANTLGVEKGNGNNDTLTSIESFTGSPISNAINVRDPLYFQNNPGAIINGNNNAKSFFDNLTGDVVFNLDTQTPGGINLIYGTNNVAMNFVNVASYSMRDVNVTFNYTYNPQDATNFGRVDLVASRTSDSHIFIRNPHQANIRLDLGPIGGANPFQGYVYDEFYQLALFYDNVNSLTYVNDPNGGSARISMASIGVIATNRNFIFQEYASTNILDINDGRPTTVDVFRLSGEFAYFIYNNNTGITLKNLAEVSFKAARTLSIVIDADMSNDFTIIFSKQTPDNITINTQGTVDWDDSSLKATTATGKQASIVYNYRSPDTTDIILGNNIDTFTVNSDTKVRPFQSITFLRTVTTNSLDLTNYEVAILLEADFTNLRIQLGSYNKVTQLTGVGNFLLGDGDDTINLITNNTTITPYGTIRINGGGGYDTLTVKFDPNLNDVRSLTYTEINTGDRLSTIDTNNSSKEIARISKVEEIDFTASISTTDTGINGVSYLLTNAGTATKIKLLTSSDQFDTGKTANNILFLDRNIVVNAMNISFATRGNDIENKLMYVNIIHTNSSGTRIVDVQSVRVINITQTLDTSINMGISNQSQVTNLFEAISGSQAVNIANIVPNSLLSIEFASNAPNNTLDFSGWQVEQLIQQGSNYDRPKYALHSGSSGLIYFRKDRGVGNATDETAYYGLQIDTSAAAGTTIIVPQGVFFLNIIDFDSALPSRKIVGVNNSDPDNYAIVRVFSPMTITSMLKDNKGTTEMLYNGNLAYAFEHITVFLFSPNADNIRIAEDSLYVSNKVVINMDGVDFNANTPGVVDTIDLSAIQTGKYVFEMTNWISRVSNSLQRQNYNVGMDPNSWGSPNNDANVLYTSVMSGSNETQLGLGMIFQEDSNKNPALDKLITRSLQDKAKLFYRFKGVEEITLTSSDDTYRSGRAYVFAHFDPNGTRSLSSIAGTRLTDISKVDAGSGYDTYLYNTYYGNMGSLTPPVVYNKIWTLDSNGAIAFTVKPSSGNTGNHEPIPQLLNFEELIIDDYSNSTTPDLSNPGATIQNRWKGMEDDIIITQASINIEKTTLVDLGGRYALAPASNNTPVVAAQVVTHISPQSTTLVGDWIYDPNKKVDSYIVFRQGNTFNHYKNFDVLKIENSGNVIININTRFDFDTMKGSTFYIDLTGSTGNNIVHFGSSNFNNSPSWDVSKISFNGVNLYRVFDRMQFSADYFYITIKGVDQVTAFGQDITNDPFIPSIVPYKVLSSQALGLTAHTHAPYEKNGTEVDTINIKQLEENKIIDTGLGKDDIYLLGDAADYTVEQIDTLREYFNLGGKDTFFSGSYLIIRDAAGKEMYLLNSTLDDILSGTGLRYINGVEQQQGITRTDLSWDSSTHLDKEASLDKEDISLETEIIQSTEETPETLEITPEVNLEIISETNAENPQAKVPQNSLESNLELSLNDIILNDIIITEEPIFDFISNSDYTYALNVGNSTPSDITDLNMTDLFALSQKQATSSSNEFPPQDLLSTINDINNISEELITDTMKLDEANSISFALHDSTTADDTIIVAQKKNNSDNNGGNNT